MSSFSILNKNTEDEDCFAEEDDLALEEELFAFDEELFSLVEEFFFCEEELFFDEDDSVEEISLSWDEDGSLSPQAINQNVNKNV